MEARIKVFKGDQILINAGIDWVGATDLHLKNPFGNDQDYLVQHEPRKDGSVILFEFREDKKPRKVVDLTPGEVRSYFYDDETQYISISHEDKKKRITKLIK